jgi:hypothetical protein
MTYPVIYVLYNLCGGTESFVSKIAFLEINSKKSFSTITFFINGHILKQCLKFKDPMNLLNN